MKLTKKKVILAAVAVCLVAILSMGTLAWFNASQSIDNIFQVSTDESGKTPDFSLTLYENIVDPDTGKAIDTNNDGVVNALDTITTTGNTYTSLAPGDELDKNPTVVNTGAYDQYIRVTVTLTDADKWVPLLANYGLTVDDVIEGYNENGDIWQSEIVDDDYTDGTIVNEYYLKAKLTPDASATLFTGVNIPGVFTNADIESFGGEFGMNIVADAIQADNTGDNAYNAFALYWNN